MCHGGTVDGNIGDCPEIAIKSSCFGLPSTSNAGTTSEDVGLGNFVYMCQEEGQQHLKSGTCRAKWNETVAQDGNRTGTRLCMGQWNVHKSWYEDQTESNIE
jgi:hypothetical protein